MASFTKILKIKRKRRHKNAGHKRKMIMAKASTLSAEAFFASCGEVGKRAPAKS